MATVSEDTVEYSFAVEYDGPPINRELPKAVPIIVNQIPIASAVSLLGFPDNKLSLPVVQPIPNAELIMSKDLKLSSLSGELLNVSPTSVIAFESGNNKASEGSFSKELGLGTETTVSPSSINNMFEETRAENCTVTDVSSGDLKCYDRSDEVKCCSVGDDGESCEFAENLGSLNPSGELSGNSGKLRLSSGFKESSNFNESNRTDWASNESIMSMDYLSSRVSSRQFGDRNGESMNETRRAPMVTFCDIKSDDGDTNEEFSYSQKPEVIRPKKDPAIKVKKGACHRCIKRNRFIEKEVCMVCDAKYCSNCVLKAMGSMPEGRKCVGCIGYPIDEAKRSSLGKCSRMLKRLLNELEIRQIMNAETMCEVNQLPPEYICVNGRPLYHDELVALQSCPNPPKKLNPGNYWYDKVSGLWGKDGQKPSQIISPHLNVGGPIKPDASNGNTQVFINGRQITKVELRMLKLAGVQCAGNPHFWVNEDGSYQEEGQKNKKGYIWGKPGTKFLCAVLSLPVPSKSSQTYAEQGTNMVNWNVPDYLEQRTIQKLLLIGYNGSGTSTMFKQAKILYKDVPFTADEREHIKSVVQTHVYRYIAVLLEGRERFEEESMSRLRQSEASDGSIDADQIEGNIEETLYSLSPRLKEFSDWLLKIMATGTLERFFPAASREYAPIVEELWSNAAFQATYKRRDEIAALPNIASYFLERAVDILKPDYMPSDVDILYAEGVTSSNGLSCVDFTFPGLSCDDDGESGCLHESLLRYQLIRLQAKGFGENCKWLQMFEDVRIVIFCVSLTDYDQYTEGNTSNNKMMSSRKFFETMVTHPTFDQMDFLLLLNKYDLFEDKIEQVPLSVCEWFEDFSPVISSNRSNMNNPTLGQLGFHYIAVKFKRLYSALTGRKLYVSMVNGLEPSSVDGALKYAREIVNWDEEKPNFSISEYSNYSTEASSFSQ